MWKIEVKPKFIRRARKLPKKIQLRIAATIDQLKRNPFSPALKTHKLHGALKRYCSCSVDYSHRIIFRIDQKVITLVDVGNHSVYDI